MRRYKKVIIWVAVADLLLLAALLVLCVLVDRRVDVGRSEKTSSTLDGVVKGDHEGCGVWKRYI